MNKNEERSYCGRLAFIGQANAGKSSLINALTNTKVSITAPLPHTTRGTAYARIQYEDRYVVGIDTPGEGHMRAGGLGRLMHRQIEQALLEANGLILVIDARRYSDADRRFLKFLAEKNAKLPLLVALNKIDSLAKKSALFPLIDDLQQRIIALDMEFHAIIPISAQTGYQLEKIKETLFTMLPPVADIPDPPKRTSDQFTAGELMREQLFRRMRSEVPFGLYVVCERMEEKSILFIDLTVVVMKENHKPILLGEKGARMKSMASAARKEMEDVFKRKIMLKVRIRTDGDWHHDIHRLSRRVLDEYSSETN